MDFESSTTYCYSPCDLNKFTCEFRMEGQEDRDCAQDLRGTEYWKGEGIHDHWMKLAKKDDEWAAIADYWYQYHHGQDEQKEFNPLCGVEERVCLNSKCQDWNPEDQQCDVSYCYDPCNLEDFTC